MTRNFNFPENATPIDDFSGLKIHWVQTLKDLNRVEAENILKAYKKYFQASKIKSLPLTEINTLKKIHADMFSDVWDWAGSFRKTEKTIGIPAYQIQTALYKIHGDVEYWQTASPAISLTEQAAMLHHRLVYIHPFENGNGRFARFVADLFLFSRTQKHFIWPTDLGTNSVNRKAYIVALKSADEGSYNELVDFLNTKCRLL